MGNGEKGDAESKMEYRDGDNASSDIDMLKVNNTVLELVEDIVTRLAWLATPWNSRLLTCTPEPSVSVRPGVVEIRYFAAD